MSAPHVLPINEMVKCAAVFPLGRHLGGEKNQLFLKDQEFNRKKDQLSI